MTYKCVSVTTFQYMLYPPLPLMAAWILNAGNQRFRSMSKFADSIVCGVCFLSHIYIHAIGKRSSLTEVGRAKTITLHGEGYSERDIAAKLLCSKTVVHNAQKPKGTVNKATHTHIYVKLYILSTSGHGLPSRFAGRDSRVPQVVQRRHRQPLVV